MFKYSLYLNYELKTFNKSPTTYVGTHQYQNCVNVLLEYIDLNLSHILEYIHFYTKAYSNVFNTVMNYLTTVNFMEPKQAYEKFENELLELLPSDQQEFIAQLERKGVIDAEDREKMNVTSHSDYKAFCTAIILENIEGSLIDSDEKFYALLDVMEEYKNGLDSLALKIKNHLDPSEYISPYMCIHKDYKECCTF